MFPAFVVAASGLLYLLSRHNYLLFHSLVELGAIMTSSLFFAIAVIMLRRSGQDFLYLLATGFFGSAIVDLVHTLAYKGMGVFPGHATNLPTQLWIMARYLEAFVILGAAIWLGRRLRRWWPFPLLVGGAAGVGIALAFLGWFPTAYVEGSGLTAFKIVSEYVISGVLLLALALLARKRRSLTRWTFGWLAATLVLTVLAEISFTQYVGVYGFFNSLGHIFKFMAYAGMFRIVLRNMLERPLRAFGAIVPMCAGCKAVRLAEGTWVSVEDLLSQESGKMVTHGLCPTCYEKAMNQYRLFGESDL